MIATLANSRAALGLGTLAGIQDAKLAGEEITGRWINEPYLYVSQRPGKAVIENFLNWGSEPGEILRFVRKYGPLSMPDGVLDRFPPVGLPTFHEPLQEWRDRQEFLRRLWSRGSSLAYQFGLRNGEMLRVERDKLLLIVGSLARFLECEIFLHPSARRRICANPTCESPYFIAKHLRQFQCSDGCARWAQQEYKRTWWNSHGEAWRQARVAKKKKTKHHAQ
jgi:hypothetical protein